MRFAVHLPTDTLTIFETKDILYHFNGGWLYNEKVDPSRRLQTDREIIGLRIAGTLRKILEEQVVDFSCESEIKPYIGTMIILIPILVFVIPSLVSSVLVLFLWKKRSKKTRPDEGILGASSSSAQTLPKDEKSSSSS